LIKQIERLETDYNIKVKLENVGFDVQKMIDIVKQSFNKEKTVTDYKVYKFEKDEELYEFLETL